MDLKKTDVILSHNDSDHFSGIPKLIEAGKVGAIFTTLLLKEEHIDKIYEKLDDTRRTEDGTKNVFSTYMITSHRWLATIYGMST